MIKIAIKELAYFTCQSGNLTPEFFSNRDLQIGKHAHDYLQSKYNEKSQNKVDTDEKWKAFLDNVEKGTLSNADVLPSTFDTYLKNLSDEALSTLNVFVKLLVAIIPHFLVVHNYFSTNRKICDDSLFLRNIFSYI